MPQQPIDFQPLDFQPDDVGPKPQDGPDLSGMSAGEKTAHVLLNGPTSQFFKEHGSIKDARIVQKPGETIAELALMAAVPGILGVAGKYGGPAIRATAETVGNVLSKPAVGAGIGAAEGYRRNGVEGAVMGAATGYAGSSATAKFLQRLGLNQPVPSADAAASERMVHGMSQAGAPRPDLDPAALIEAAIQRGLAKGEAALAARTGTPPQPTPAPPIPTASPKAASTLEQEILARISAEPDWRTVDVVPKDAMKTPGIIEPGESRVGLAERMAQAMKVDPAEAERLAKALRQRMHISAKK